MQTEHLFVITLDKPKDQMQCIKTYLDAVIQSPVNINNMWNITTHPTSHSYDIIKLQVWIRQKYCKIYKKNSE